MFNTVQITVLILVGLLNALFLFLIWNKLSKLEKSDKPSSLSSQEPDWYQAKNRRDNEALIEEIKDLGVKITNVSRKKLKRNITNLKSTLSQLEEQIQKKEKTGDTDKLGELKALKSSYEELLNKICDEEVDLGIPTERAVERIRRMRKKYK